MSSKAAGSSLFTEAGLKSYLSVWYWGLFGLCWDAAAAADADVM